jgi:NAD(P)-dependent dehydrogenase (short-subunit alcohol dehydrogenase family)
MAIHDFVVAGDRPSYTATKNAATLLLQQIAKDTPVAKTQIVSFHPGSILSEAAKRAGYDEKSVPWDDGRAPSPSRAQCRYQASPPCPPNPKY